MNKIAFYILLILIYLGVAKSTSPVSEGTIYIKDEQMLSIHFKSPPSSLILANYFKAGIFIKTYYHTYKTVFGFNKRPNFITVRVSQDFYEKNLKNIGMSIFRYSNDFEVSTLPLPPGSLYIGDLAFGNWIYKASGSKVWHFHPAYRNFPVHFGWGDFVPSYEFYLEITESINREEAFFGFENEFGTTGKITLQSFSKPKNEFSHFDFSNLKKFTRKYISTSSKWKKNE